MTRAQAAARAIASTRAEGLDPRRAELLLAAWARGELTAEQLDDVRLVMLHERDLAAEQLLERARRRDAAPGR